MASWIGTGGSNPGDVATNGKIGAGVSSPSWSVDAAGRAFIRGANDGGGGFWSSDSDDPTNAVSFIGRGNNSENHVGVYSNGAWRMIIKDNGCMGLGTTDPKDKFDLGGKFLISDSTNPVMPPANAVVLFFDGTNLKVKRSDGKTSTLSGSWS